jgi:hypothetical protein
MKKKTSPKTVQAVDEDMRPEYDFSGGVRGKYAKTLREEGYSIRIDQSDGTFTEQHIAGEKTITLDPDVSPYFPNSKAVNRALRGLIELVPAKQRKMAADKR